MQSGAVPSAGRCDLEAGCCAPCVWNAIVAFPALPDPRCAGSLGRRFGTPFHSKKLQRSHVPQKLCNSPRGDFIRKVSVKYVINHNTDLLNEQSTTGFRLNSLQEMQYGLQSHILRFFF
ncbi:hypothetical protein SAMN05720354_12824 [Nitrosospira sp. Nsp1]|nr:hypothetical protein SAMN05720354_12824 [Nitrosospira sp. Nsp1]